MATVKRQRSCIACGRQADKVALLRIVRDPSGAVAFDATGRAPGRGAYVCSEECFAAACTVSYTHLTLPTNSRV